MSRRFLHWFAAAALAALSVQALAAVDVNAADESALIGIKGIGPVKARAILDERAAGGPFRDAADLAERVKGLGGQALLRLQAEGLRVGTIAAVPFDHLNAARALTRAQAHPTAVALRGADFPTRALMPTSSAIRQ